MEEKVIVFKGGSYVDWIVNPLNGKGNYATVTGTANVMGNVVPKVGPAFALEYDINTVVGGVVVATQNRRRIVEDFFNQVKTSKAVNQQVVQVKVGNDWLTILQDRSEANKDCYVRSLDGVLVPTTEALVQPILEEGVLVNPDEVNKLKEGYMTEYEFLAYLVMPVLSMLFGRSIMNRVNITQE